MGTQLIEKALTRVVGERDDLEQTPHGQELRLFGAVRSACLLYNHDIGTHAARRWAQVGTFGYLVDDDEIRLRGHDFGNDVHQHHGHSSKEDADLFHRFHISLRQCEQRQRAREWIEWSGNGPVEDAGRWRTVGLDRVGQKASGLACEHRNGRLRGRAVVLLDRLV